MVYAGKMARAIAAGSAVTFFMLCSSACGDQSHRPDRQGGSTGEGGQGTRDGGASTGSAVADACAGKNPGDLCGGDPTDDVIGTCTESGTCSWSAREPNGTPCVHCSAIKSEPEAIDGCEVGQSLWYRAGDCLCDGPCAAACSLGSWCAPTGDACMACILALQVCAFELKACADDKP